MVYLHELANKYGGRGTLKLNIELFCLHQNTAIPRFKHNLHWNDFRLIWTVQLKREKGKN